MAKTLYVTVGTDCYRLSKANDSNHIKSVQQEDLYSTQQEADTRMFLHANRSVEETHQPVVLRSPDTDVLVIAMYVCHKRNIPLIFRVQQNKVWRYLDVTSIVTSIGEQACNGLPGMHSGCDSTSQFAGHGEKTTTRLLLQNNDFAEAMNMLGQDVPPTPDILQQVEAAICILYNKSILYKHKRRSRGHVESSQERHNTATAYS